MLSPHSAVTVLLSSVRPFFRRGPRFLHSQFVATRVLSVPLSVLHFGNNLSGLATGVIFVGVSGNFLLGSLFPTSTWHELVLVHVILVVTVVHILRQGRHRLLTFLNKLKLLNYKLPSTL